MHQKSDETSFSRSATTSTNSYTVNTVKNMVGKLQKHEMENFQIYFNCPICGLSLCSY